MSKLVEKIRTEWAESDRKRDEGLTALPDIRRHDNISYGPYDKWNLTDIYYQKTASAPQPAIVNVHGGAWVYGSKELYQHYCMRLARRGFTVVNANYRLAPEYHYPAPLADINRLLCFLKEKGKEYFVDTEKLILVGDSAGAQIASQYLTIYSNPGYAELFDFGVPEVTIRAAALNCGVYDARKCAEYQLDEPFLEYLGKEAVKKEYLKGACAESLDVIRNMTPAFPPAYIMSACHDFLLDNAEPMYKKLKELGVACELKIYGSKEKEEIGHVFHVNCKLEEAGQCNDDECRFFKEHLEERKGE